jgi:hypothetical protein
MQSGALSVYRLSGSVVLTQNLIEHKREQDREENPDLRVKLVANFMLSSPQVETQGAPKEVRHNDRTSSHKEDEKPRLDVIHSSLHRDSRQSGPMPRGWRFVSRRQRLGQTSRSEPTYARSQSLGCGLIIDEKRDPTDWTSLPR